MLFVQRTAELPTPYSMRRGSQTARWKALWMVQGCETRSRHGFCWIGHRVNKKICTSSMDSVHRTKRTPWFEPFSPDSSKPTFLVVTDVNAVFWMGIYPARAGMEFWECLGMYAWFVMLSFLKRGAFSTEIVSYMHVLWCLWCLCKFCDTFVCLSMFAYVSSDHFCPQHEHLAARCGVKSCSKNGTGKDSSACVDHQQLFKVFQRMKASRPKGKAQASKTYLDRIRGQKKSEDKPSLFKVPIPSSGQHRGGGKGIIRALAAEYQGTEVWWGGRRTYGILFSVKASAFSSCFRCLSMFVNVCWCLLMFVLACFFYRLRNCFIVGNARELRIRQLGVPTHGPALFFGRCYSSTPNLLRQCLSTIRCSAARRQSRIAGTHRSWWYSSWVYGRRMASRISSRQNVQRRSISRQRPYQQRPRGLQNGQIKVQLWNCWIKQRFLFFFWKFLVFDASHSRPIFFDTAHLRTKPIHRKETEKKRIVDCMWPLNHHQRGDCYCVCPFSYSSINLHGLNFTQAVNFSET